MGIPTDSAAGPAIHSDHPDPSPTIRARLDAIDIVRGIVMVLMALDHVKHYFCRPDFLFDAVDLDQETTPSLFLTRWFTHLCAPTFVFLAGASAFLFGTRTRGRGALAWFLLSRGLWLVLLEVTVVRWGWWFNLDYRIGLGGGVIFAIGCSLIVLSGLCFLPARVVAAIGVAIICFHNLLDEKTAEDLGLPEWLWALLHKPGDFQLFPDSFTPYLQKLGQIEQTQDAGNIRFGIAYCLIPWIGVIAAGYGFGTVFLLDRPKRRRLLIGLGIALTLLFVGLRFHNEYGDLRHPAPGEVNGRPGPWTVREQPWFTLLSFLNCQKYPPSLLFLLMTLGPAIFAMGLFDLAVTGPICRFFITFGRVPLFFYLLHIPLIHGLVVGADFLRYGRSPFTANAPWVVPAMINDPAFIEQYPDYGWSLPATYLIWVGVVFLLYPFCCWFARVKRHSRSRFLSYL